MSHPRPETTHSLARALLSAAVAALMPFAAVAALPAGAEPERFVVYYGQDASPDEFASYRRAVLDADHHPPLAPLKARGIELFGYVSLAEVDAARPYFADVEAAGLLIGAHPNWPGAHYVDLRKPAWRALLLDRVIPAILAQGFEGLFLDTLDDAAFLEHADPAGNRGTVAAAADLVRAIHQRFPQAPLMLNRAFDVARLVAGDLDSVLAESLASDFAFTSGRYHLRPDADLHWGLQAVADIKHLNPKIKMFSLDYWDPADRVGVAQLYRRERKAGFIPYVATVDLQRIVPEPLPGRAER